MFCGFGSSEEKEKKKWEFVPRTHNPLSEPSSTSTSSSSSSPSKSKRPTVSHGSSKQSLVVLYGCKTLDDLVRKGDLERVKEELRQGANVHTSNSASPLIHYAVNCHKLEMAELLLDSGADLEADDCNGRTVLHVASFWGQPEFVKLFLKRGANVAKQDNPLHLAAQKGHTEVIQLLLNANAPTDITNQHEEIPLATALHFGHIAAVSELLRVSPLQKLKIRPGAAFQIPLKVIRGGKDQIECWLAEAQGNVVQKKMKLLLLGNQRAGKSTLIKAMKALEKRSRWSLFGGAKVDPKFLHCEPTSGLEVDSEPPKFDEIQFQVWDFAGQYQSLNRFVLSSSKSIYLIVIDTSFTLDEQRRQLHYWLGYLQDNIPYVDPSDLDYASSATTPFPFQVLLVGAKTDQACESLDTVHKLFQQVVTAYDKYSPFAEQPICLITKEDLNTVEELKQRVRSIARKVMNQATQSFVPQYYQRVEDWVAGCSQMGNRKLFMSYSEVEAKLKRDTVLESAEEVVMPCLYYLHDIGALILLRTSQTLCLDPLRFTRILSIFLGPDGALRGFGEQGVMTKLEARKELTRRLTGDLSLPADQIEKFIEALEELGLCHIVHDNYEYSPYRTSSFSHHDDPHQVNVVDDDSNCFLLFPSLLPDGEQFVLPPKKKSESDCTTIHYRYTGLQVISRKTIKVSGKEKKQKLSWEVFQRLVKRIWKFRHPKFKVYRNGMILCDLQQQEQQPPELRTVGLVVYVADVTQFPGAISGSINVVLRGGSPRSLRTALDAELRALNEMELGGSLHIRLLCPKSIQQCSNFTPLEDSKYEFTTEDLEEGYLEAEALASSSRLWSPIAGEVFHRDCEKRKFPIGSLASFSSPQSHEPIPSDLVAVSITEEDKDPALGSEFKRVSQLFYESLSRSGNELDYQVTRVVYIRNPTLERHFFNKYVELVEQQSLRTTELPRDPDDELQDESEKQAEEKEEGEENREREGEQPEGARESGRGQKTRTRTRTRARERERERRKKAGEPEGREVEGSEEGEKSKQRRRVLKEFGHYLTKTPGSEEVNLVLSFHSHLEANLYNNAFYGQYIPPPCSQEILSDLEGPQKEGGARGDYGYYGRGAYFSLRPTYAAQFMKDKKVIQLSWLLMGRVYPAVEYPKGKGTLHGKPCVKGFDSHYVLVNKNTLPCSSKEDIYADEIVIFNKNQVLPQYLIYFEKTETIKVFPSATQAASTVGWGVRAKLLPPGPLLLWVDPGKPQILLSRAQHPIYISKFATSAEARAWMARHRQQILRKHCELNAVRVISNCKRAKDGGDMAGKQFYQSLRKDNDWMTLPFFLYCGENDLVGLKTNSEERLWVSTDAPLALRFASFQSIPLLPPHRFNLLSGPEFLIGISKCRGTSFPPDTNLKCRIEFDKKGETLESPITTARDGVFTWNWLHRCDLTKSSFKVSLLAEKNYFWEQDGLLATTTEVRLPRSSFNIMKQWYPLELSVPGPTEKFSTPTTPSLLIRTMFLARDETSVEATFMGLEEE